MNDTFVPFSADRMFCSVLVRNPDIAREMLELILETEIDHVECINAHQILNYSDDDKTVRLDVFLKDGSKICYDIEMENSESRKRLSILPIRSRLYSGAIDTEMYSRGTDCEDVTQTYVIFICKYDPYDKGLAKYTSTVRCSENSDTDVQNGITYVYLNCNAKTWNVSEELAGLLSYIRDRSICTTELTKRIDYLVTERNNDEEWRRWFVTLEQKLKEEREDALELGESKGRIEERTEAITKMIRHGLDDNLISSIFNQVTPAEVASMRQQVLRA